MIWPTRLTYQQFIDLYVRYVMTLYNDGRTIVVLDGYGEEQKTKSLEQRRRASVKSSADINMILDAQTTTSQDEFLNNMYNNDALISELTWALLAKGIQVRQSSGDADVDIIVSATEAANSSPGPVTVISRDTDVVVLLLARLSTEDVIRIQHQLGMSNKYIRIQDVKRDIGQDVSDILLPLHVLTGCDTTSVPFRKGKKNPLVIYQCSEAVRSYLSTFTD